MFLWDVAEGKTLRRWWGHGGRVNAVSVSEGKGDVVVSGKQIQPPGLDHEVNIGRKL